MPAAFLNDLNVQQQKAVIHETGPALILAGAGSGKTRVLTYRVAHLIADSSISAQNILCLTFTNKAAGEMKERIISLMSNVNPPAGGQMSNVPWAGTFHSMCAKILRSEGKHLGISPDFLIYDTQDQKEVITEVLKDLDISKKDFHPGSVLATISGAKNELIGPTEYPQYARGFFQETVARIYLRYQAMLKENQALDFDDLLLETVRLWQNHPEVLAKYQEKFPYILVDEYQDTNHAQYLLSKLLAKAYRNIYVVGDAAQAIYAWRGADYRNILRFKDDFPEAKIYNLEQNYRSSQTILSSAYAVISKNTSHPILKLWTDNAEGEKITIYDARNEHDEAAFITEETRQLVETYSLSDIAVLYRTNAQSRLLEEALLHESIPYTLIGGVRFYERKEVKDVLSYLRLLVNSQDTVSYRRVAKLGKGRLAKFLIFQQEQLRSPNKQTLELLDRTLEVTNYLDLYDRENEEDRNRLENIKELRSVATEFPEIMLFLENVALVEQEYYPDHPLANGEKKAAVTLMTMHAAKGLEFPVVFIVGMEEGLFPHSRSLLDRDELEEERRLCYVGITRAMRKLYFTYATKRLFFGTRMTNMISRFIVDIPESLFIRARAENDLF